MTGSGPQTLDGRWQHVNQALDAKFPGDVRNTMEQLFYAGASSALAILVANVNAVPETIARLVRECGEFAKPKVRLL